MAAVCVGSEDGVECVREHTVQLGCGWDVGVVDGLHGVSPVVDAHDAHEDGLSWQVLPASAKVLAVEEARGIAMEQAQDSAEVCVACACADAGVERKAGVCVERVYCGEMGRRASWSMQFACRVSGVRQCAGEEWW